MRLQVAQCPRCLRKTSSHVSKPRQRSRIDVSWIGLHVERAKILRFPRTTNSNGQQGLHHICPMREKSLSSFDPGRRSQSNLQM